MQKRGAKMCSPLRPAENKRADSSHAPSPSELESGTVTPYRGRGTVWVSICRLTSTPFGGPARGACEVTGLVGVGSDCDGEHMVDGVLVLSFSGDGFLERAS